MKTTWKIIGKYGREKSEVIDTASTWKEAKYLANEYRMAFGIGWTITIK